MKIIGVKKLSTIGKTVSLFSGAGGLDIGLSLAGFQPVWSNEIDRHAVDTYRQIFPDHVAVQGDLLDQEIPRIKNLDLVVGGPPCQGFSVAGKMDPNDPRSKHVWNFLGVVDKLRPRGFVMENVKALAVNNRWSGLIKNLQIEAEKMGYETTVLVLNAADYGVPQARERMFLVGLRNKKVSMPQKTRSKMTVREAISILPKVGEAGNDSICTAKITPAVRPILRQSPFAGMLFNGQGRPLNIDKPALTLPASMGGNRTPIIDQAQLDENTVPWVVKYHKHLLKGGQPYKSVPKFLRRLTVEESAIIQTFPIGMTFSGTQTNKFKQIGNAVPPLLAYHVGLAVRNAMLNSADQ